MLQINAQKQLISIYKFIPLDVLINELSKQNNSVKKSNTNENINNMVLFCFLFIVLSPLYTIYSIVLCSGKNHKKTNI